jgi:hypothetical protein
LEFGVIERSPLDHMLDCYHWRARAERTRIVLSAGAASGATIDTEDDHQAKAKGRRPIT